MRLNQHLAIVIPVWNRAEFVARSLEVHVPLAEKNNIGIYISDNCSEDNTGSVVREWMEKSPIVFYSCNEKNIGADRNFEKALNLPEAEYVWLLGDTYQIPEHALGDVLALIQEHNYSAIITNLVGKLKIPNQEYRDFDRMLADLCSIISCLSCLIYSKRLIKAASYSRYYQSYFIQSGIILEYVVAQESSVFWAGDISVSSLSSASLLKTSWVDTPRVAEIGVEKWVNFIFSLPPHYSLATKLIAAKNFGLLTWRGIGVMRANGFLTPDLLRHYQAGFALGVNSRWKFFSLFIISRLPVTLISGAIGIFRRYRGRCGRG